MKTSPHARSNQPSKDGWDLNVPAPKIALTSEITLQPATESGTAENFRSQDQTGHQNSPRKPYRASYFEEEEAQKDITGLIQNFVESDLTLWSKDKGLFYEYVLGSLRKHNILEDHRLVLFERNRQSGSGQDDNIMGSIYPIYIDREEDYKLELFKADLEILRKGEPLEHIESIVGIYTSIIAIYRGVIDSYKKLMRKPDIPLAKLPEVAPVLWEDSPKREKPIEFINRVYGDYIRQGMMTQGDLRHLDYKLYRAFHNWCGRSEIDPKTIVPAGRRRTEKILDEFGDLTYENSLGLVFKTAHAQDTVPSELVRRGEAFFSLLRRRKINMKQSP